MAQTIISVTSVPRRFNGSLKHVLSSLEQTRRQVIVSLPKTYNKWGAHLAPDYLSHMPHVVVHRPDQDFGPATKLLGGLAYLASTRPNDLPKYIVTFDDDCISNDPNRIIEVLEAAADRNPQTAITFCGMKLDRHPYETHNGLFDNNVGYVDGVIGWSGVLYPVLPLLQGVDAQGRDIFGMLKDMPPVAMQNDDVYFGVALARLGVPILSIRKRPLKTRDGQRLVMRSVPTGGKSAVLEAVAKSPRLIEGEIFQYAVQQGWLPGKQSAACPVPLIEAMLRRSRYGRALVNVFRR